MPDETQPEMITAMKDKHKLRQPNGWDTNPDRGGRTWKSLSAEDQRLVYSSNIKQLQNQKVQEKKTEKQAAAKAANKEFKKLNQVVQERERLTQAYRPSKVSEKVTTVLRKGCDLANIASSIATYTKHVRTITSLTIAVVSTGDRYVVEQYSFDLMILLSICLSIYLQAHIFIYYFYNPLAMRLYPSTHTTISIRIYVLFSFSGDEVKEQHIYLSSTAAGAQTSNCAGKRTSNIMENSQSIVS